MSCLAQVCAFVFCLFVVFLIGFPMSALCTSAPGGQHQQPPLYKVLRCLHTRAVRASSRLSLSLSLSTGAHSFGGRGKRRSAALFAVLLRRFRIWRCRQMFFCCCCCCASWPGVWRGINWLPGAVRRRTVWAFIMRRDQVSVVCRCERSAGGPRAADFMDSLIDWLRFFSPPFFIRGFPGVHSSLLKIGDCHYWNSRILGLFCLRGACWKKDI